MQTLFTNELQDPLASRMRPQTLEEYIGQHHLMDEGKLLRQMICADQVPSMIFWGPPGVGKTTLAQLIATLTHARFIEFSAVTSGMKEIKEVMKDATQAYAYGEKTILFVDEIHRFNKAQQDAFLPFVEKGTVTLIGATTENPSVEMNSALLSGCKVFVLKALSNEDLVQVLKHALQAERGFGKLHVRCDERYLRMIADFAGGDARMALNTLEMVVLNAKRKDDAIFIEEEDLKQCISVKSMLYDKKGEEHYNLISALHKSMRNSDTQAALYWLARMLEAGEDPLYVARRLVRFASEDIGMADSRALEICVAVFDACHDLGMPECSVHLAHAVTYLSLAPKSNALYVAYEKAAADARKTSEEGVPLQIRNAPTRLMKELDYGKDYDYAHDHEEKITGMYCLPPALEGTIYYTPTTQGSEAKVGMRMKQLEELRRQLRKKKPQ